MKACLDLRQAACCGRLVAGPRYALELFAIGRQPLRTDLERAAGQAVSMALERGSRGMEARVRQIEHGPPVLLKHLQTFSRDLFIERRLEFLIASAHRDKIVADGGTPWCVRALMHLESDTPRADLHHVYLEGARSLRDDLPD